MKLQACDRSTWEVEGGDWPQAVICLYAESLKPAWALGDPISNAAPPANEGGRNFWFVMSTGSSRSCKL